MAQPQLTVEWPQLTVEWPQLKVEWPLVRPKGHFLKISAIIFAACVAATSGAPTQPGTMDGIDAPLTHGTSQVIMALLRDFQLKQTGGPLGNEHKFFYTCHAWTTTHSNSRKQPWGSSTSTGYRHEFLFLATFPRSQSAASISAGTDLWSAVQFSTGITPSSAQACNDSSVFPPVPQGYRSNLANAFSKLCIGDWSGFGIHLQFSIKSIDESNEHQVIEDRPETIAVFIVGRSWSSSNWKREIRSQWEVGSLKSILCSTSFLAILDFHVTSTSNCGPSCLVDNNDRRDSLSYFESCVWTFVGELAQHWLQSLGMNHKKQDWLGS